MSTRYWTRAACSREPHQDKYKKSSFFECSLRGAARATECICAHSSEARTSGRGTFYHVEPLSQNTFQSRAEIPARPHDTDLEHLRERRTHGNCLYTDPRAMAQSGIAHFFREAKLYPGADPRSYRIACRLLHHEKKSVLESRLSGGPSDQSRAARQSATAPRAPPRTTSRPSRPRCTASGRGPGWKRLTRPVPVKRVAVTRA